MNKLLWLWNWCIYLQHACTRGL